MNNQILDDISNEKLKEHRDHLREFNNNKNIKIKNKLDELYKEYIHNDLSFQKIELLRKYNEYLKRNI